MPIPVVWTERGEAPGIIGLHDCTQSATLDALVYAGHKNFPLGIYTMEERNAFESSDDRPDNTGATLPDVETAAMRRYGRKLRKLPDDSEVTFRKFLDQPGFAFIVQGWYKDLPTELRHWQPSFTGGHCMCFITLGNGKQLLLDPLATARYKGDVVTTDVVVKFAWDGAAYSRYLIRDEFAEHVQEIDMHMRPVYEPWTIRDGAPYWTDGPDPKYDGTPNSWAVAPDGFWKPNGKPFEVSSAEEWRQKDDGTWTSGAWRTMLWRPGTPGHTSYSWFHRADITPLRQGGVVGFNQFVTDAIFDTSFDVTTGKIVSSKVLDDARAAAQSRVDALSERLRKKDVVFDSIGANAAQLVKSGKAI